MGGFAFRTTAKEKEPEYIRDSPNLVLSRIGLNFMIDQDVGALPYLAEDDIRDMGKADALTKCIVCFQAFFIIVQSIARYAKTYPVSLLELNTVGHCICALLMYLFWFRKPKDVKLQTFLNFDGADNFAAFLYFGSAFRDSICPNAPDAVNFLYGRHAGDQSDKAEREDALLTPLNLTDPQRLTMVLLIKRFENMIKELKGLNPRLCRQTNNPSNMTYMSLGQHDLLRTSDPLRKRCFGILLDAETLRLRWDRLLSKKSVFCLEEHPNRKSMTFIPTKWLRRGRKTFQYSLEGPAYDVSQASTPPLNLDDVAMRRLKMVLDFMETHLDLVKQLCVVDSEKSSFPEALFNVGNGVVLEAPNWPTQVGFRGWSAAPQSGVSVITVLYGGFHLLALCEVNTFPTHLERYLWMASCACLASTGFVIAIYSLTREAWRRHVAKKSAIDTTNSTHRHDSVWHARWLHSMRNFVDMLLSKSPRQIFFPRQTDD
jgi:hypothetical protein